MAFKYIVIQNMKIYLIKIPLYLFVYEKICLCKSLNIELFKYLPLLFCRLPRILLNANWLLFQKAKQWIRLGLTMFRGIVEDQLGNNTIRTKRSIWLCKTILTLQRVSLIRLLWAIFYYMSSEKHLTSERVHPEWLFCPIFIRF